MDRNAYKDNKWKIEDLYKSEEDFNKELKKLETKVQEYSNYKGKILESSDTLLAFLKFDTEFSKRLEQLFIYAHINNDSDTRDSHYQELYGKVINLNALYNELTSYVVPELLVSDYSLISKYLEENKELKEYERNLKKIYREKEHILSKEEENIISNYSKLFNMPEEIESVLTDSDFTFDDIVVNGQKVTLTESNYNNYIRHSEQAVRKSAFLSLYKTYKKYNNTLAAILKSEIELHNINAKVRKYSSALEASLYGNEIDSKVYYNLIESVHKNLQPLYDYFTFKKNYLKLDEFHIYDTYTDLNIDDKEKISFNEAQRLILAALKPLGKTYIEDLSKSFTDGWIDSINNKGKRGGAYCTSCYNVHPYVLMSYEESLEDVSTLAHELGHAMHYYYACKYQNYQDYAYSIFVAEVASQVNEILLCRYLLDNTSDNKKKIKIIDNLLGKFKSTIFRQTMFAEFELFMHEHASEGNILTKDVLNDKYYELNKLYYGTDVIVDDEIKYEWSRIPHFYYNYYVYQYATGFAAAVKIANQIYAGNEQMKNDYLEFLKLGATLNPIESLRVSNVDITSEEVIDDAISYMKDLVEEIKKLSK